MKEGAMETIDTYRERCLWNRTKPGEYGKGSWGEREKEKETLVGKQKTDRILERKKNTREN